MSDHETYLAIARAWNVGAGASAPATGGDQAYTLAARAWDPKGETILPRPKSAMAAIAAKWDLDDGKPKERDRK